MSGRHFLSQLHTALRGIVRPHADPLALGTVVTGERGVQPGTHRSGFPYLECKIFPCYHVR